jgi:hypothetical protein
MSAAVVLAIIEAIKPLRDIYLQTVDLHFKKQEAADISYYDKNKAARDAIIARMKMPGVTDAELKDLRHSLYNLRRS